MHVHCDVNARVENKTASGQYCLHEANFYGAYILRNLSSGVQQDRTTQHNREQGHSADVNSDSRKGEGWVQCGGCGQWAHRECAGPTLTSILKKIKMDIFL